MDTLKAIIRATIIMFVALTATTIVLKEARADQSIMFEVGWRFDNAGAKRNAFDFGAIRYRHDDGEAHLATWADDSGTYNVYAAGIGYTLDADDSNDGYVSFTPGLAITSSVAPVRLFTRTAVGYASGDMTYEAAHNAYMPTIESAVASDAFETIGVAYNEYDESNGNSNVGQGGSDDTGDDGTGDDNGDDGGSDDDPDTCKPGHGHGDTNHCHSGPPGRN